MALTQLQSDILRCLAKNRSETSYLAGGLMLNKNWQRRSDDIDIFHDTDEEVTEAAEADIALLDTAGYKTHTDFIVYGCVDATVSDGKSETIIQWFAETKRRFFPLVKDEEWGARLHQADLAVNKVLAASGRSKARDIADLVAIIPAEEFLALKGLPADWIAEFIRDELLRQIELADKYIMAAPPDLVGILAVSKDTVPIEVTDRKRDNAILRKATEEPEVMPSPAEFDAVGWSSSRP